MPTSCFSFSRVSVPSGIGLVLMIGAAVLLSACGAESASAPPLEPPVRPVKMHTVQEAGATPAREYPGTVSAAETATLSFELPGTVVDLPVQEGERVEAGQLNSRVLEGGAGTESLSLPGGPTGGAALPQAPNTTWNVGLSLSLPLFTGLKREGQIERGRAQLSQLKAQRREVRSSLEERIRSRTEQATSGYLSLREAEAGRRTAQEAIDLVQDSYTAGAADVLDLLDAQEAVLNARLAEADARYSFLRRLLQTERAIARPGPLQTADERAAVRERLRAFMDGGQ